MKAYFKSFLILAICLITGNVKNITAAPIKIMSVTYGGAAGTLQKGLFVDLLQKAIGDSSRFSLPNAKYKSFNDLLGDPLKGKIKTLSISYFSDGVHKTVAAKEGGSVVLYSTGQMPGIIIRNVTYGNTTSSENGNFAKLLQNAIENSVTYTLPNSKYKSFNELFGDPTPGKVKNLSIEYVVDYKTPGYDVKNFFRVISVREGQMLIINPQG